MNKYICIHGHFYQPPRENPWLEEVELQESAQPYHDWNERITAECYAPNAASRILDSEKRIINIVNNYMKISFDFGPTLLSWLERHSPDVYQGILEADRESQKIFSGHGSAIAQGYNHMILPLANERDKRTQVIWGIKDFESRFKRKPEGMWLPETAVDTATLEILAEEGILFTILTPYQAKRVRKIGEASWQDVASGGINPQIAYLCQLPSGKKINLFFYDGPVSHDVAFVGLLKDGRAFAERLTGVLAKDINQPGLANIATDGETYGHHHRHGDMALAYCLYHIESNHLAKVTIYGEFLEKNPPLYEVEISENSSWSCGHGVERWRSNCGCSLASHLGWQQQWRKPLRDALDWLRDNSISVYEEKMKEFSPDPWKIRDQYIQVILNRSPENVERFFAENICNPLNPDEKVCVLKLLELQRHAMLMYTSCGWFFDEISGIETTQILQYAARVIQLAKEVGDVKLESHFTKILEQAPSNIPAFKNGAFYYYKYIKPANVDLLRVGAHYAMSSLFEGYPKKTKIYCYSVENEVYDLKEAGKQKLVLGRARIYSDITWEESVINFVVLHLGDHNLNGGVRGEMGEKTFGTLQKEVTKAFLRSDISTALRIMNDSFGTHNYSLWHLFRHEKKKISEQMLRSALKDIESHSRQIYQDYYPFIQASHDLGITLPKALSATVESVLNRDLLELLENDEVDLKELERIVAEVNRWSFQRDRETLGFVASKKINQLMEKVLEKPEDLNLLQTIESLLNIFIPLSLDLDLWKAQNVYFKLCKKYSMEKQQLADGRDEEKLKWLQVVESLGHFLDIKN